MTTNPKLKHGHPKLKASVTLNGLRFGLTFDQFRTATYLQQWVELHQFRPSQSPLVAPKYWWHYAAKCVIGQRSGQAHRRAHRWDFTRLHGAAARRRRYVELYKRKLAVDALAAGEDTGLAAGDKVLPAGIAREIDNLEVKLLTFEQALLYRYLAEVCTVCVCLCGSFALFILLGVASLNA